ncbi:MAG: exlusion protein FxsA [Zetaproteobacteria bacterium]|nr:MAG: exlusion protein FxsA [Zetaproteobacteria bacterium]
MPFIIIFVLIPLSEIMVFINVSSEIGLGSALLIALLTAVLGGFIVKYQGINTMMTAQKSLQAGHIPSKELFDGLCLVAAGATLITPGFITDAIGFALLVPAVRDILRKKLAASTKFESMHFDTNDHRTPQDPNIIEVEYETIEDDDKP